MTKNIFNLTSHLHTAYQLQYQVRIAINNTGTDEEITGKHKQN